MEFSATRRLFYYSRRSTVGSPGWSRAFHAAQEIFFATAWCDRARARVGMNSDNPHGPRDDSRDDKGVLGYSNTEQNGYSYQPGMHGSWRSNATPSPATHAILIFLEAGECIRES